MKSENETDSDTYITPPLLLYLHPSTSLLHCTMNHLITWQWRNFVLETEQKIRKGLLLPQRHGNGWERRLLIIAGHAKRVWITCTVAHYSTVQWSKDWGKGPAAFGRSAADCSDWRRQFGELYAATRQQLYWLNTWSPEFAPCFWNKYWTNNNRIGSGGRVWKAVVCEKAANPQDLFDVTI